MVMHGSGWAPLHSLRAQILQKLKLAVNEAFIRAATHEDGWVVSSNDYEDEERLGWVTIKRRICQGGQ